MNDNILDAVIKLAATKQMDSVKIQESIIESVTATLNKRLVEENELQVLVDDDQRNLIIRYKSFVKEQAERDNIGTISLEDARKKYGNDVQIGDVFPLELSLGDFEHKLAKTLQKIIRDKIRSLEDEKIQKDFNKQKHTIVSGRVKSLDDVTGGYSIDLGYTDALLPIDEQIESEYYRPGDIIKAYVTNIRSNNKGTTVVLSRTNPEFVKRLFEAEIPSIFNGKIKIRKIVRDPGIRTKVQLEATEEGIDPITECVGPKGTRIDSIRRELYGEQIDLVEYSEDLGQMVINALGVPNAKRVVVERGRAAAVIVDEADKLTAIGKQGKNVKLAAKLTGLKIDIFTTEEYEEKLSRERRTISHVSDLDGVTPKIAEVLRNAGYTSVQDIFKASVAELSSLEGLGPKTAEKLKEAAKYF